MIIWGIICIVGAFGALGMGAVGPMVFWAALGSALIALGIHRNKQKQSQQQTVIVNNYTAPAPQKSETQTKPAGIQHESVEDFKARLDAREARIQEDKRRFERLRFPVAGVTFQNADGTDRQKLLREIALNNDGVTDVFFREDDSLGEESGIEVLTEYGCVGFVRRSDKAQVRRFFDRMTHNRYLSVERFENDEGQKIYRADVCITMDRDDPDQRWYFDDLPEQ